MTYAELRPAYVRVLGRNIPITYELDNGDLGKYDRSEQTIEVAEHQPPVEEADTVLHEIIHAVWATMDIGHSKYEEHIVRKLSTGLTAVFQDNPALVQYLVEAGTHQ